METGRLLADGLLEAQLAACVQMMPIQSSYRWKGVVQSEAEMLMLIKMKIAQYPEIEAWIRARHPYETPEIILIPIAAGLAEYLEWIKAEKR